MIPADSGSPDPDRFRLLATFLAGRSLGVAEARAGEAPHTDGWWVFVSAARPVSEQRREVFVQAALLGAGSLDPGRVRALRGRPKVARRYLALEGHRVLAELAPRISLAAALGQKSAATTATAGESLEVARGRGRSPTRRSGSASSDPRVCWVRRPPGAARGPATAISVSSSIRPTFPRLETMRAGKRARRARSSRGSGTRSPRTSSRTSSTS